jgi:type IV secretory pathway VirB4 component
MAKFEKLSKEEVERITQRKPRIDISEYVNYLETLNPGEWGAVTLEEGETGRAIKRRLTIAAKQLGKNLRYRRSEDNRIIFTVR